MPDIQYASHRGRGVAAGIAAVLVIVAIVLGFVLKDPLTDLLYRLGFLHVDVTAELTKAETLREQSRPDEAIRILKPLLNRTSKKPELAALNGTLGIYLYDQGQFGEAIKYLKAKRQLTPNERGDSVILARALWKNGQKDEAKTYYSQAIDELKKKTENPQGPGEIKSLESEMATGPQE